MGHFEKLLYLLFPTLRISSTPWYGIWQDRDHASALFTARIALPIGAIVSALHYVFIDTSLGLTNDPWWAWYRFGVFGFGMACFAVTMLSTLRQGAWARIPFAAFVAVASVAQAWSMTRYAGVPYVYAFILPTAGALLLRTSALKTVLFLILVHGLQIPAFIRTQVEPQQLWSAFAVTMMLSIILRAQMPREISIFLSEQEKLEAEKKLIESELELAREVRAFLPKELYERVKTEMSVQRKTVLQAMDESLRPRSRTVACVFSDIRGFTQRSRDVEGFLREGALPNIRECTDLVEDHHGIPRLIGDLIFAYYDGDDPRENLVNAIESGFELARRTQVFNANQPLHTRVPRHVLVSFGEALVGNIGGFDSSREITALGPPVNILSRIDPLTKEPQLQPQLDTNCIILTHSAGIAAQTIPRRYQLREINLARLGLTIRDFPEETIIFLAQLPNTFAGSTPGEPKEAQPLKLVQTT